MVIAPNRNGEWIKQDDPEEIFAALINEYNAKYHQTESTPPMSYPLQHYLGYLGNSPNCNDVLNRSLPHIPGIQAYSLRLLEKLRRIDQFQPIPVGISKRDYQQGWKKPTKPNPRGEVFSTSDTAKRWPKMIS